MIIIKSMSRKTPSFSQLINYINKGREKDDEYIFRHNIYSFRPHNITQEFRQNHESLKKRKDGNSLYHEIISIKFQQGYTKEQVRTILQDLTEKYVQVRANNCLVYGVIHEQHNQIHAHLMISSNELENSKPHYFSQDEFEQIKNHVRQYAYEKYPKLEQEEIKEKNKEKGKDNKKLKRNPK